MAGTDEPVSHRSCNDDLQRSRDYLDAIVSGSLDSIVVFDERKRIEYVNDAACRFIGLERDRILGRLYKDFVPPELVALFDEKWERMTSGDIEPYEAEVLKPDGSRVPVLICDKFVYVGGQRKSVTVAKDISELKAVQKALQHANAGLERQVEERTEELAAAVAERDRVIEALRESEGKSRELVENCGLMVMTYDSDCRIRYMNTACMERTVLQDGNVVGKHVTEVLGPELGGRIVKRMAALLATGETGPVTDRITTPTGPRWLWSHPSVMRDESGKVTEVTVFMQDITGQKLAELELHKSEHLFRDLVNYAGFIVIRCGLDGTVMFMNDMALQYGGGRYRGNAVVGMHLRRIWHPTMCETFMRGIRQAMEKGKDLELELEMTSPKGTRWFWARYNLMKDADGNIEDIIFFAHDTTRQKLAEMKLKESEEDYRMLTEKSGLAMSWYDREARLVMVNALTEAHFGAKSEHLLGRRLSDIVSPPYGQTMENLVLQTLAGGRDIESEDELMLPVGRRWILARLIALRDAQEAVTGVIVYAHDITEQKISQLALHESESRRRMLTDTAMEAIFMHEDGILLEANPKFYEMFGYQPEEIIGRDIRPLTLAEESIETIVRHYRNTEGTSIQAIAIRKDGTRFPMETRGVSTIYKGRNVRVGVITDVSDRVKAEAELAEIREKMSVAERLASVGYIGATMAHEVNTPLSVMRLTLQMCMADLRKLGGQEKTLAQAETILREIGRVSDIMRRYREMSRPARDIGDNAAEIRKVPEQVRRVFQEAAQNVKLRIRIGDEVPELLARLGNVNDAEQLMFVLVQNAVQAADSRKHQTLSVTGCIKGDSVELRFADDCCGIPPENLAKIFEPFFSTKPRNTGTGLGLSIVRRLLQERGGRIQVESEPGKGTTFTVTYPA